MTPSCPSCGRPTRPSSRFCPHCGNPIKSEVLAEALLHSDDYRLMRSISKGGMGAVYLAADRRAFDRLCVAKKMLEYYDPSDPEERASAHERFVEVGRTLASLSHPGIP